MGRKSETEGIRACVQLIHSAVQQKLPQHREATILKLKKKQISKRKYCIAQGMIAIIITFNGV